MSAQPAQEHDPDDPLEILRMLPERFHEQLPSEYAAVAEAARRPEGYQALCRLGSHREALRAGRLEGSVPVDELCRSRSSFRTGPAD